VAHRGKRARQRATSDARDPPRITTRVAASVVLARSASHSGSREVRDRIAASTSAVPDESMRRL
jgi:hypothetical protein